MSDILSRLEAAITDNDPDLNARAPQPAPAQDAQAAPPPPQEQQDAPEDLDFKGEDAQTPVDASQANAPAPQQAPVAQPPQTAPAMQQPRTLSANDIISANVANNANVQAQQDAAYGQKRQALVDSAGIEQQRNDLRTAAGNELVNKEHEFQKARDIVDTIHMEETNASTVEFDKHVQEERDLAARNPHDFWGNSNTVNKIGALVAMIGAGLAHQDATKAFQNIIDNRVAESNRRSRLLQQIGHDLRYKNYQNENKYRTQLSSVQAKRVAAITDIQDRLKVNLSKYANPQVQANFQNSIADLDLQKAKDAKAGIDDATKTQLQAHQARMQELRLAQDQQELNARTGAQSAQANAHDYQQVAGISGPGVKKGQVGNKFIEDQAISADLLGSLDQFEKETASADSLDTKAQQLAVQRAFVSGDIRKKLGVGARVEGEEGKNMAELLPAFNAYFAGEIGYGDLKKKINEIKRLVVHSHLNRFNSVRHNDSEITPQYPLYGAIKNVSDGDALEGAQQDAVGKIEDSDIGNPQKAILDLEAAGADKQHPNPLATQRAQQLNEQLHPSVKTRAQDLLRRFKGAVL